MTYKYICKGKTIEDLGLPRAKLWKWDHGGWYVVVINRLTDRWSLLNDNFSDSARRATEVKNTGEMIRHLAGAEEVETNPQPKEWEIGCTYRACWLHNGLHVSEDGEDWVGVPTDTVKEIIAEGQRLGVLEKP